jgi:serine/threonine-protein kinase RsbW
MTLELHATPGDVMRAVENLLETGRARQVPEQALAGMALALEECGSNIVNHALHRDACRTFRVTIGFSDQRIEVELRDAGDAFDPTMVAAAEAEADDDRPPGGWGLFLVRRNTDEIQYRREHGENVLRLGKNFSLRP